MPVKQSDNGYHGVIAAIGSDYRLGVSDGGGQWVIQRRVDLGSRVLWDTLYSCVSSVRVIRIIEGLEREMGQTFLSDPDLSKAIDALPLFIYDAGASNPTKA